MGNDAPIHKICVVTGTRAEFGLLRWLMHEIAAEPLFKLQVVASAMHLSPQFGYTLGEIEAAGFVVDARVESLLASDSVMGAAKSVALALLGFAEAFERLLPQLVVILGDRYEALAAAEAAMIFGIPIAHIHGGEVTEGCVDDAIRHSITKMSALHFVAAEPYRQRVLQMGEQADRVFNVGAPGIEGIHRVSKLTTNEVDTRVGLPLSSPTFLITYHPETAPGGLPPRQAFENLIKAVDAFPHARVVITRPNADPGNRAINDLISSWAESQAQRITAHSSLGQELYINVLMRSSVVIGNSSSGLIEAPAVKVPTVNIGDRQRGRLRSASVIDCSDRSVGEIRDAIAQSLSPGFTAIVQSQVSVYGNGETARSIVEILKATDLSTLSRKSFCDIGPST